MNMPPSFCSNPIHLLALGFGSGLAPKAPGTFGTLVAIPFFWLLSHLSIEMYLVALLIAILAGIWLCGKTSRDMGAHVHPSIVWDEFCGYWITMFATPASWSWIIIGFLLFRLFDIWKPYPVSWLDKNVQGGLGIMVDDMAAGLMAWIVIQGLQILF